MTVERVKELFKEAVAETKAAKEAIPEVGEGTLINVFNYMLQVAVQEEAVAIPEGSASSRGGLSLV